jgi:hypothetical protein
VERPHSRQRIHGEHRHRGNPRHRSDPTDIAPRETPAPPQISAAPAAVDPVALDTQDCIKSSQTLQNLAQAIADAGGAHGPAVAAAADHAETRMNRRLTTHNEQLHAVFSDLKDAVSALAESTRRGGDANTAVARLLTLIDQLDARCQAALNRH